MAIRQVPTSKGQLFIGSRQDVIDMVKGQEPHQVYDIIWNLAEELEYLASDEGKYSKQVLLGKIEDYNIPDDGKWKFTQQLGLVFDALRDGGKILIHCLMGHGRTGTIVAIIKKCFDGCTNEEALACAKTICNGPERKCQVDFVKHYQYQVFAHDFHAHIYFDKETKNNANRIREKYLKIAETDIYTKVGRMQDNPIGPHPISSFQISFSSDNFLSTIEDLMFHNEGLSILIHPNSNDGREVKDHTNRALWINEHLELDISKLEDYLEIK